MKPNPIFQGRSRGKLSGLAGRLNQPGDRVVLIKAFASKSWIRFGQRRDQRATGGRGRAELIKLGIQENRMLVQQTGKSGSGGRGEAGDRRVELITLE